jgi:pseudaminic acid synthase
MEGTTPFIEINGRRIGPGHPTYVIAEISANHNQSYDKAARIVEAAVKAGADAVKLQTYTADTITLDVDSPLYRIGGDTLWDGETLHSLYKKAYTPWEWQPRLMKVANDLGADLFSSPFDFTAVDFLDEMNVPAFKVASFESNDTVLVNYIASKGKPVLMSTGMATLAQVDAAVTSARAGAGKPDNLLLFKCVSAYPAPAKSINLRTIPHMREAFGVPVGFSDHTLGIAVAPAAVAIGACAIEKHVTLSRADGGPDAEFSVEIDEFEAMVQQIRMVDEAVGEVHYGPTDSEQASLAFRRSLIVTEDLPAGSIFTAENVRSLRPGYGMSPGFIDDVIGRIAADDITRGTPLTWDLVSGNRRES